MTDSPKKKLQVIAIGIGGASCSGKTTLAKHLRTCLPNSLVLFQDDFAPSEETLPLHPKLGLRDWDDPPTAIDWDKMANELLYVKEHGRPSDSHLSHDHLNAQKPVEVDQNVVQEWKAKFIEVERRFAERGEEVVWVIVEGFLLYWDSRIYNWLNVRVLLRIPESLGRERRKDRQGYFTAEQLEGGWWEDPPTYWEDVVWPAFLKAHAGLFADGDAGNGTVLSDKVPDLITLDAMEISMTQLLERLCDSVMDVVRESESSS